MTAFSGAAFLRGINVGGHTVTSARLRELFDDLGLSRVTPVLASGNLIFSADSAVADELVDAIEAHLLDRLGFEVPTFVRSRSQMIDIANHDPFGPVEGRVHVAFLDEEPHRSLQDEVRALCRDGDQIRFEDTEMFWHVPGPFMKSALSGAEVGRLFGNRLTVRTAGTVERVAAKLSE